MLLSATLGGVGLDGGLIGNSCDDSLGLRKKKNRRGCRRFVWGIRVLLAYAVASPAALWGKNQK